jgi:beta-fructofuranosidase
MPLTLPDKWVWDFWLVRDGTDYHAFYLQAPRSLGDPELRHLNVSVGHAGRPRRLEGFEAPGSPCRR